MLRVKFPFGRVFVAASPTVYADGWLPLDQELVVTLRCTKEEVSGAPAGGLDFSRFAASLGLSVGSLSPDTRFVEDLGADSLDAVELVMELEEEFDIHIPEDEAKGIKTVGDGIRLIEKYRDEPPPT